MSIPDTVEFLLTEPTGELPNSSVIKANNFYLQVQKDSFNATLAISGNLPSLANINNAGILARGSEGYVARNIVSPKQTISIDNQLNQGGNITLNLNPETFIAKVNVSANGTPAANPRSTLNFVTSAKVNYDIRRGPRNSAYIALTPIDWDGLEGLTFTATSNSSGVLNLFNVRTEATSFIDLGFKITGVPDFSVLVVNEAGDQMGWQPLYGLESLTAAVNENSTDAFNLVMTPNNPTEDNDETELTFGFSAPTAPAGGEVIVKTADGFEVAPLTTGVTSVGINLGTTSEIMTVTPSTITESGSFQIGFSGGDPEWTGPACPAIAATENPVNFEYYDIVTSFTLDANTNAEDVFIFENSDAPQPITFSDAYNWSFNTSGVADRATLKYNHGTGKVAFAAGTGSDIGRLEFTIGTNAENVLEIVGSNEIILSQIITFNTIPPVETSYDGQTPTLLTRTNDRSTCVINYATLATGPLQFLDHGEGTFAIGETNEEVGSFNADSADELENYIVLLSNGGILNSHNFNRGLLTAALAYTPGSPGTISVSVNTTIAATSANDAVFQYYIYYKN